MLEEIKKGVLTTLGGMILTKEKIEETVKKLVDESKLREEDAQKLIDDLLASSEKQADKIETDIRDFIEKRRNNGNKIDIAQSDDFINLQQRVDGMEARISLLENNNLGRPDIQNLKPVS